MCTLSQLSTLEFLGHFSFVIFWISIFDKMFENVCGYSVSRLKVFISDVIDQLDPSESNRVLYLNYTELSIFGTAQFSRQEFFCDARTFFFKSRCFQHTSLTILAKWILAWFFVKYNFNLLGGVPPVEKIPNSYKWCTPNLLERRKILNVCTLRFSIFGGKRCDIKPNHTRESSSSIFLLFISRRYIFKLPW